jgi:hypothetical protein
MVTKCNEEENRVLFCYVSNRTSGSKPVRRNDIEEASEATYVEMRGFMAIRQK